ncbi:MAG: ZIP family metal transporter [Candidatus Nanohaloarchaea archaeon]
MKKFQLLGFLSTIGLVGLSVFSLESSPKLVFIGFTAFSAMVLGAFLNRLKPETRLGVIWIYGLSGGAAFASVLMFVMPQAVNLSTRFGVAGIVAGFIAGLTLHSAQHELSHRFRGFQNLYAVSIHAAFAGVVIGLIYQQMPEVSVLLGVAIVSHKLPAAYIIADRLKERFKPSLILFPASIVGFLALTVYNFNLNMSQQIQALFFGFSTGIFLHLALDFIPEPEPESMMRKLVSEDEDPAHSELDSVRNHCIVSTSIGAFLVLFAAFLL